MNPIRALLEKFRDLRPPEEETARHVSEALKEALGIDFPKEKVRVRRGVAFVEGSSTLKSEASLEKNKILAAVRSRGSLLQDLR